MKFFMFGQNMLLRDEESGAGDDGAAAASAGEFDGKPVNEAKAAEDAAAAAAADKAKANEGKTPEEIKAAEDAAAADKAKANEGKTPEEIKAAEEKEVADKIKEGEEKAAADKEKGEGAPESYEAFELPDGYDGVINETDMESFSKVAKDLNLDQKQAQQLIDLEVARQEQMIDAYAAQTEQWQETSESDEEIGGADADIKQGIANKAYDALVTDEFRTLMNPYHPVENPKGLGLGNHPEVVRLFYRIGLKISEDGLVMSDGSGETKLSRESVLYGDKK